MTGPALSVVMPVRNVAPTIGEALDAVLGQEWSRPFEVVIVDNGSTDTTQDVIQARAADDQRIRVIVADERAGVSYARNVGIEAALSDRIAICDGDDVVADGWVGAMGGALDRHEVVTGPLELERLNPPWLAASRGFRASHGIMSFQGIFDYAAGGNIGIRRETWQRVGRFDEDQTRAQDIEFSMRLWQAGVVIAFEPEAVVHYRYRAGQADLWRQGRAAGRARVRIAKLLVRRGLPRPSRAAGWKSWLWLLAHLPGVLEADRRAQWVWVAGNRVGNLEGSLRERFLFL